MGEKARSLLTYNVMNVSSIDGFKYAVVVNVIDPAHASTQSTMLAAASCRSVSSPALLSMLSGMVSISLRIREQTPALVGLGRRTGMIAGCARPHWHSAAASYPAILPPSGAGHHGVYAAACKQSCLYYLTRIVLKGMWSLMYRLPRVCRIRAGGSIRRAAPPPPVGAAYAAPTSAAAPPAAPTMAAAAAANAAVTREKGATW
jgi:hypothetical protein